MKKTVRRSALLEIGVEELPARFITPALKQMESLFKTGLEERGLSVQKIETMGTPRRLAAILTGLPTKSEDRKEIQIGPPPKAAKGKEGEWTQAALGFARAQKVNVKKLELQETTKGQRYVVTHLAKGQPTEQILKTLYPKIIESLSFPKSMRWEPTQMRFARPIRWIVSLFNSKVVRFKMAGVTADRTTVGLLALGGTKIRIPRPERYRSILQGRCILVDPQDRLKKISGQLDTLSKRIKAKPMAEPSHLEEVVHLTEYPTSILGHFPESYLKLPKEVLVSVLRKHQKFFPLESSKKIWLMLSLEYVMVHRKHKTWCARDTSVSSLPVWPMRNSFLNKIENTP